MSKISYTRKIIGVEADLGFLYIPSKGQGFLPSENKQIPVSFNGIIKQSYSLSYNPTYNRIFGLTSCYKKNNIIQGSLLNITIENEEVFISIYEEKSYPKKKINKKNNTEKTYDISNLSSIAKGNILEDRIKEVILILGQGLFNVYKPVIDNEGIDLIVIKNGQFHSIFLQVKSRYNIDEDQKIVLTVSKSFKPHHSYYIVGVTFDSEQMEIGEKILLIPSTDFEEKATELKDKKYRISASLKENSNDKWQEYIVTKDQLVEKLFEKFAAMEEHYK